MTTTTDDQRQNFRIKASDGENGAGVAFGNRLIKATAIDFSTTGAKLVLHKKIDVAEGDRLRVAIPQGQYVGLIRRLRVAADGKQVVGVEFISRIEEKIAIKNSTFIGFKSGGHEVSGSFFPALICIIIAGLCAAFYAYYHMLTP